VQARRSGNGSISADPVAYLDGRKRSASLSSDEADLHD